MRLQTKLLCITIIPLILLLTGIMLITQINQRQQALASAETFAENLVRKEAAPMLALLDHAYTVSQDMAHTAATFKMRGNTDRGQLIEIVRQIQLQNLDFMGSWLMFEPDVLDGADSKYLPGKIAEHDKAEKGEEKILDFSEAAKLTMKELYGPLAD